jgi:aspartyl/glutamyl-tRNA(Asn/Gln) amidotransferase C subunit
MISKEEVEHIAKLARLELTEGEVGKMQKDLSAILDYFNLLKKAPKPEAGQIVKGDLRATRKDEVISSYDMRDEIIAGAPDKKDDYIKVKTIL